MESALVFLALAPRKGRSGPRHLPQPCKPPQPGLVGVSLGAEPEAETEAAALSTAVKVLLLAADGPGCLEKGPGLGLLGPEV